MAWPPTEEQTRIRDSAGEVSMIAIDGIDHLVLTVADIEATCVFYRQVLGFERLDSADGRVCLTFAGQRLNLHPLSGSIFPRASRPLPGSADFCLATGAAIEDVVDHLRGCGVRIEVGPVTRTGARGPMTSVYVRDPDGNLLEIASYR
jgi:catechol 2,3-dioxygenase-like lactoylglutathione lyase family enzyme